MHKIKILALLFAALLMWACTGHNIPPQTGNLINDDFVFEIKAVADSSLEGLSCSYNANELVVTFDCVPGEGQFASIQLPGGFASVDQHWIGNEETVNLMVCRDNAIHVGVAPLSGYLENEIVVSISLGRANSANREVLNAPVGDQNQLVDLTVEYIGDGNSRLEWTEVNSGDYDFNSEVNIADIAPIAIQYGQSVPDGNSGTTEYWVDGDKNGEINLADITPIAINFQAVIESYKVIPSIGSPVIVPRSASLDRQGLPPLYSVEIPGNVTETWQVMPIDGKGQEGEITERTGTAVDLVLDLNITGIELYDIDGSGSFGLVDSGRLKSYLIDLEPLRRLLPGEDPDMLEIGEAIDMTTPSVKFVNVPRDRHLALMVLFIPTIDLATGVPRDVGADPGLDIWVYNPEITIVPFNFEGVDFNANATITLDLVPGPFDGYYSNITTAGLGLHPGLVHLDNADGVLHRDSNESLTFEDDPRMLDEPRWGITNSRLEQLAQLDEYSGGTSTSFMLTAIVTGYNQGSGEIGLENTMIDIDGPSLPTDIGEITLMFSEYSTFASKPFGGDLESPIDPGIIEVGTELEIQGYKLVDDPGDLDPVYWGEHIVKIIR